MMSAMRFPKLLLRPTGASIRYLSEKGPLALLNEEQETLLLRIFRNAGPLTKRQLANLIEQGGLRKALASKAVVDRHVQHLTKEMKLVVKRGHGSSGTFALAPSARENTAQAPP